MILLSPLQSYPLSQTNLLKVFVLFNGKNNTDFLTNGVGVYGYSADYSSSLIPSQIITSVVEDSTATLINGSGPTYNRTRVVSGLVTGYNDVYNNSSSLTMSIGANAGLYGYVGGPYSPGIMCSTYQYLYGAPTYITMSGLNVGTYDLYLYAVVDDDGSNQYSKFTLQTGSGIEKSTSNVASLGNGDFPVFVENNSYVKFSNHYTSDGIIRVAWAIADGADYGPINGIQIVQTK
jgi:hypothetical protein